jgi:hypothetical protein
MTQPTEFVMMDGLYPRRGLPDYIIPRTQVHDDKTIDILMTPLEGSGDAVGFKGYYIRKRPLDLPNPLAEHPFLKENADAFVASTAPLKDVVPSLDAVLTHAIPVSRDPYGEAQPFLKLWDVQLASIPWSAWTSKFPPVEVVKSREPAAPIEIPKPSQLSVPEKIQSSYGVQYPPGLSVRLWLQQRLDAGGLVVDLLRSSVIDNGSVASVPTLDLPKAAYPDTTIEACSLEGKSFPEFVTTGILRRTFLEKDKDPYASMKYQCVPLEFIKQERAQAGILNRLPWKETTGETMKTMYLKRLAEVTPMARLAVKEDPIPKAPASSNSVRRAEVLAIQSDGNRYADDKVKDIRTVLTGTTLTTNLYSDPDGGFVVCSHTLALLGGDLAANRQAYYDTWTARVDGFRVCKFCGEQINADVYEDVAEYDEDGFVIQMSEALSGPGTGPIGVVDYRSGLQTLERLFKRQTAHDDTVFLILSLLQVLPSADVLEKFLVLGRQVAAVQFTKGTPDVIARAQGTMGLATAALILQCHIPSLVPRRSFGPKPLIMSGYPRDSPEVTSDITIVDTLMGIVRKTFEAFPTTFGGPSKPLVKAILTRPGDVKTQALLMLSNKSPLLKRTISKGVTEPTFGPELLRTA